MFVLASQAKAACDFPADLYATKLSEACQKDLTTKATNEQDKIYLERMFKNWVPFGPEYDISREEGYLEVYNSNTGEINQIEWVNYENPAIAYINGQLVVDSDKDASIFRRLERMMDKSETEGGDVAMNPLLRLLRGENAEAAKKRQLQFQNSAFIFALEDGKQGKAEDLIAGDSDGWIFNHSLKSAGYFPNMKDKTFICDGNRIRGDITQNLGGKDVLIKQGGGKTEFSISGLIDGKVLRVNMKPRADHQFVTDDKGRVKTVRSARNSKRRVPLTLNGQACQTRYNSSIVDTCKEGWEEFAKSRGTAEEQQAVRTYIESVNTAKGGKAVYGRDFSCLKLYETKGVDPKKEKEKWDKLAAQRRDCMIHFNTIVPPSRVVSVKRADYSVCDANGGNCKGITPEQLAELRSKDQSTDERAYNSTMDRQQIGQKLQQSRKEYADAVAEAVKEKNPSLSVSDVCGAATSEFGGMSENMVRGSDGSITYPAGGRKIKYAPCRKPDDFKALVSKEKFEILKKKFDASTKPDQAVAQVKGSIARGDIEKRLVGAMMMSQCCGSAKCQDVLKSKMGIELRGTRGGTTPNKTQQ
jgi:hypothetical protein